MDNKLCIINPEIIEHDDHIQIKSVCGFGTISFTLSKQDENRIKLFLDIVLKTISRANITNQLQNQNAVNNTKLLYKLYCFEIKCPPKLVLTILNKYWCPNGHYYNPYLRRCSC